MQNIMGIDPGPEKSAWCLLGKPGVIVEVIRVGVTRPQGIPLEFGWDDNGAVLKKIRRHHACTLVCEWLQAYVISRPGAQTTVHPIGQDVLHTARWVGRFEEAYCGGLDRSVRLLKRPDIAYALLGNRAAKATAIKAFLYDEFGGRAKARGTKAAPGPLYGIKDHVWDALAVAYAANRGRPKKEGGA